LDHWQICKKDAKWYMREAQKEELRQDIAQMKRLYHLCIMQSGFFAYRSRGILYAGILQMGIEAYAFQASRPTICNGQKA
jgi:hypothetical protein